MMVKEAINIFKTHNKIFIGREPKIATVTFLNISKSNLLIVTWKR